MQPIVTIFCSFTRQWAIDKWIENLKELDYPKNLINLALIVDIDDPWIAAKLVALKDEYRDFEIQVNRDHHPNEVRPIERRKRIAEVKQQSKKLVKSLKSDYVLGLEDDTVFDDLCIERLLVPFTIYNVGMVEGVQCGRWHNKMIGAWQFDDIEKPQELVTLLPGVGFQEIDAGGFYGYIITRENYLAIPYNYNNEVWGPDVNAGLWLKRQGFNNYIDWDMNFGHNVGDKILWPDTDLVQYKFRKINDVWTPIIP